MRTTIFSARPGPQPHGHVHAPPGWALEMAVLTQYYELWVHTLMRDRYDHVLGFKILRYAKNTFLDMIVSKYQNIVFCCCCCCFELNRLCALTDEQPWAQGGYLGHMGP